jgi:hypothetical protein
LVASSSAFEDSSTIYTSPDSGATWLPTSAPTNYWLGVASSADGMKLVAVGLPGVFISTNAGASWNSNNVPSDFFEGASCSADGTRIATLGMGTIYLSTNSGTTWTSVPVPMAAGSSLASSADGTRLVSVYNGLEEPVYISTNSGATWVTNDTPIGYWAGVTCSADGYKMAAAMWRGPVCTSQSTPSPVLHASLSSNHLTLAWTIPSISFVLHESPDVTATHWTVVTNTPTLNYTSLENQLTVSPGGSRYYRLIAQ